MGKSWNEKLTDAPAPHTSVLKKPFAGLQAGDTLFIASPLMVRDYMQAIPAGECRTIVQMRKDFAAQSGAKATCPLTASLFARIAAEAALEDMARGRQPADTTPFWRLIDPDSAVGKKLSCGSEFVRRMRAAEASTVQERALAT
jgi:hypothetical protein